jgi:putative ABC transport system permease protein
LFSLKGKRIAAEGANAKTAQFRYLWVLRAFLPLRLCDNYLFSKEVVLKPMKYLCLVLESFRFAWQALKANLMRTTLSLLGVTIGIFAIVAVFTIVDSLERSIRNSMSFLGEDVIYVQRFPWKFDPNNPWWKYLQRPYPTVREYRLLEKNLQNSEGVAIFWSRNSKAQHRNNSMGEVNVHGVSYEYSEVADMPLAAGRYFSTQEVEAARPVAIIGSEVAEKLFPFEDPVGKQFKVRGYRFTVIGVLERQGKNLLEAPSNDTKAVIPYTSFMKMYATGQRGLEPVVAIKGREEDTGLLELEYEVKGMLRNIRGLKPREEDNFALNRPEMLGEIITSLFAVVGLAGWVIGGFSILVGGFGIANIMFVSVKERTNIIGIQKSLGAKNYFILYQFLFEAVFLSLIGGGVGIFLVFLLTVVPQDFLAIVLSWGNILLGLSVSVAIGVVSGIIPAVLAARLDPVIAIRSK